MRNLEVRTRDAAEEEEGALLGVVTDSEQTDIGCRKGMQARITTSSVYST